VIIGVAGFTFIATKWLGSLIRDLAAGEDLWFGIVFGAVWIGVLAPHWAAALGRFGVRLRPDGIVDRQVFGSLFVPWTALATPYPAVNYDPRQVTLFLAHPERTRRRGFRHGGRELLPAAGVNAELLARAIHEYTNRPELRAAIGSEAELTRFLAIPQLVTLAEQT
jgi:hypothetical protein